ncbi:MAG: DMT family transporter [Suipraeoptans sp.]
MKKAAPFLILIASLLWASMGIVTRFVVGLGYSTIQTASVRLIASALFFLIVLLITNRKLLKIELKDLKWFLLTGIVSLFLNNVSYAATVQRANLSVAVVLLYTAPFFVMIMSIIFFKEKITINKIAALFISFIGCIFVVGLSDSSVTKDGVLITVLIGLVSGFSYGTYTIISKILLKKYESLTVAAFSFFVAAIVSFILSNPSEIVSITIRNVDKLHLVVLGSIVSVALPYVFYSYALKYVESSKAPILASFEVVAASLYGVVIHKEVLTVTTVVGISLIIFAIVILQMKNTKTID